MARLKCAPWRFLTAAHHRLVAAQRKWTHLRVHRYTGTREAVNVVRRSFRAIHLAWQSIWLYGEEIKNSIIIRQMQMSQSTMVHNCLCSIKKKKEKKKDKCMFG